MVSGSNDPFHLTVFSSETPIADWLDDLDNFLLASYGVIDGNRKKAALLSSIGAEGKAVIKNLPADQTDTYEHLVLALKNHYKPETSEIVERNIFFSMFSEINEPVESFITRLRTQANKCNFRIICRAATDNDPAVFHDLSEMFIRDRLVVGWTDGNVKRRLMRESALTLEQAITMIKSSETANKQLRMLVHDQKNSVTINAVRSKRPKTNSTVQVTEPQVKCNNGQLKLCKRFCGRRHLPRQCPAFGQLCNSCGKKNHFASVCMAGKRRVNAVDNNETDDDYELSHETETLYLGEITAIVCEEVSRSRDWTEKLCLNDKQLICKVDTGAQANIISEKVFRDTFPTSYIDKSKPVKLYAYGGTALPCLGRTQFNCCFENKNIDTEFIIVPMNVKTILGLDACIKLGLVRPPVPKDSSSSQALPHTRQDADHNNSVNIKLIDKNDKGKTKLDRQQLTDVLQDATDSMTVSVNVQHETVKKQPVQTHVTESERCVIQTVRNEVKANPSLTGLTPLLQTYADVFDDSTVGCLKNYEYDIKLQENAVPVVNAARKIPLTIVDEVKNELDRMVRLGVIAKVETPTDWVNSMVVVQRPGKMRICLDPNNLNKCVMREHTHLPTAEEILSKITGARVFTKIDAKDGYWQIPLTEKSSYLTTFNTPHGRYRYTRLPFGLNSANEVFQKQMTQAFENLEGVIVMYDDILICGGDIRQHDERLRQVLHRAKEVGLKLNLKKCKFRTDTVKYIGHIITKDGLKVDPDKVSDILNMPKPTDKAGVQRLLGSLNFLAKYIQNLSKLTEPIRKLLVKNVHFEWSYEQDEALKNIQNVLTNAPVLGYYDVKKDVTLACDASSSGLGACIMQEDRPVAYASRSLTEGQKSYSQMEKELLAIVFGAERFSHYIYGKETTVLTDHKPLINCLKRPVHTAPARIQRLLLRLQRYNLKLNYIPGKYMYIPDMLSRAYVTDNRQTDSERVLENEADVMVHAVIRNINCSEQMMSKIISETADDSALSQIKFYILNGWPDKLAECDEYVKLYWPIRANLEYLDGLVLYLDRIVIPKSLQADILSRIHEGHQGRERCKMLARKSVYWSNMNADIDKIVNQCEPCLLRRNRPGREPLHSHPVPERAWQKVAIDLFTVAGARYQLIVDYFSKWVEISKVPRNAISKDVIYHLKEVFSRFGIPQIVFSDGDPLYTSRTFNQFCKEYEFDHHFSSARYPRSNGQVERKIQHIKNIILKCHNDNSDLNLALLQYRATPLSSDLSSPAMLLMNRDIRTKLPCLSTMLNTKEDSENKIVLKSAQERSKIVHDKNTVKERRVFDNSELIRYRDNLSSKSPWKPGQIIRSVNPRSYELVNSEGNVIRRNSCLLIPDKVNTTLSSVPPDEVTIPVNNTPASPVRVVDDPVLHNGDLEPPRRAASGKRPVTKRSYALRSKGRIATDV